MNVELSMILKKFSVLIKLALISLVVWALSDIFLTIVSSMLDVPVRTKMVGSLKKPVKTEKHLLPYYAVISTRNIFYPSGNTTGGGSGKDVPKTERPETELNLELKGTITGDDKDSFAIIEDKDKRKQDLYRLDDTIEDAKLVKILDDRVVLMRNGREESLIMSYDKNSPPVGKPLPRKKATGVKRISATKYELDREAITGAMGDLTTIMTELNVKPYYVSGEPAGFQVTRITPGSLINKMGLRNGDIVKSINNKMIDSPQQAMELYQQLQSDSSLVIEIERRGRKKTYNYEIK